MGYIEFDGRYVCGLRTYKYAFDLRKRHKKKSEIKVPLWSVYGIFKSDEIFL